MAITPMKKVADMPKNGSNQSVISGSNWDANFAAIEAKFAAGINTADLGVAAGILGTQLAASTVTRSNAASDFELQSLLYWINL